jgi:two-component system NarL family sensor kinase
MANPSSPPSRRETRSVLRAEWHEIGPFGRIAFIGVLVSFVVALILGWWIPNLVRGHLLEARAHQMEGIGDRIAARHLVPVGPPASDSYKQLAEEVELSLVGGDTVRVKLWTVDGTVAYSDDPTLVGQWFEPTRTAEEALTGKTAIDFTDLSEPAHAHERYLGRLLEFYVPVHDASGDIVGLFEVEQTTDTLDSTLTNVRRGVWLAIGTGIGFLGIFMAALTLAALRTLNRRRRQAESLLGELSQVREEERRRLVGALHDDVGQTLYRLLYGLEGSRAQLPQDHPLRPELEHLGDLTRDIDRTLRTELRLLHQGEDQELDLPSSLERIIETTRAETELAVDLTVDRDDCEAIGPLTKTALVHAVREAVTNVRKHAKATRVDIDVERNPQELAVRIADDGVGIRSPEGLGIVTTRERLEALGGRLTITSGRGTVFRAAIPTAMAGK